VRGPDRLRRKRRREAAARAEAQITRLPVTADNLQRLFTAGMATARQEGEAGYRDGVRLAVRAWFASVVGTATADDPQVRALLDELDPGWRKAAGVAPGSHPPGKQRVDAVTTLRAWATAGDIEQFVEGETGRFWVAADAVDRLLCALDPEWPEFSARVEAARQAAISSEAREEDDPALFDFGPTEETG
jgi:hypothetical protein